MPRTDAWSLLNLLPNFELIAGRKDGNGMTTPYLKRLDNTTVTMPCSEVYDGFNSAYIANASTAIVYPGVYFLNVHVKKNTDYVVGVWLKGGKGNVVVLEVCRQSAVESRPGTGRASDAKFVNYVTIEKDNEWEYHEMTVNSGTYELIEVNYWIGTNGQSAYIAKPSLQESRKGDKGDPGKQGEQGKSATSYRLQLKSGTEAKVVTNGSGDDVKFTLSAIIYYLVIKNTGGSDTEVTDAKFVATIEGKDRTVLYDTKTNKGYYLEYTGTTAYTATNTPQSAIPLTVTLADGTVLNDSIPVTIQPGVAVDIDNRLNQLTTTVADKADISTLEQTAGRISAKVASLGLRNLLMDSEFRCPVEKTIKRGGKKYREAWNNGTSVTVTDTANGISAEGVNAVKATSAVSDGDWTVTRWYVPAKSGQVYTASAWCMVPDVSVLTGDSCCYLQLFACKDDLSRSNDSKAYAYFKSLSSGEWKRDTCSLIMPKDTAYTYIEVALAAFKCGTVYFRKPQLEYGGEATEWTRCADDVEGGLLATGIDIENGTVKMTGQNFQWQNTRGVRVLYMDDNGNATFKGKVTASAIEGSSVTGGTITGAKIVSENAGDDTRTTIEGGKLTTKGAEMENVTIGAGSVNYGTNRQPFACWDVWNNDTNTSDNLILPTEITQSIFIFPIPWEYECNGRVITLVNYKIAYNNSSHYPIDYSAKIVAPSGKFFFEDGIAKGSITVGREIVRIMGYGSSIDYNGTTYKEFYGWVVLSREPIGESLMRGEHQRIIYQGVYDGNLRYKAFNGASLSAKKDADGYFTISFGKPFASVNDYEVIVSARDLSSSSRKGYASVISKNTGSFKVMTAYKGAPYNGGFTFLVIPAWDWS